MLNRFIKISAIAVVLIFSSCRKYTCECTAYNPIHGPGSKGNFIVKGITKERARPKCEDHSTSPNADGSYTECKIVD